jgi:eukaryotic-like serine/threonine-protein kinase
LLSPTPASKPKSSFTIINQNPTPEGKVRYFGDYELLEEIARGGMGIVYRSRQMSLNRIVAVKMLLFGKFSSEEFVQRFRTEAQAVASLQHPNIVAIHEVGQHEGQHYFSMDYIAGKSLAEIVRERPLSPRPAATYIRSIAEAVDYAHQHGILHRDLKPSNVLIDQFDQPRITDFGLAKQMKGDSELTRTGQVLGSPHFMPPEQAESKLGPAGVHSDVYSLGAIFYHLLTGRPPFFAETLEDTLLQVLKVDPVPPRLLNPGVPRDLETICLKCLSKHPHQRYESARALVDDLKRWLRAEPILARPVSRIEKFWRWCKREPAIAGLTGAVLVLLVTVALGSLIAAFRIRRESEYTKKAELEAKEQLFEASLAQARATRNSGRAGHRFESVAILGRASATRPSLQLRNEVIAALALTDIRVAKQSRSFTHRKEFVSLDQKCENYAHLDENGNLRIRNARNDRELKLIPGIGVTPKWLFPFSPNSRFLPVQYEDGRTRIWDWQLKQSILEIGGADSPMRVDFSPDSRILATVDANRNVALYDLNEQKKLPLSEPQTEQSGVCFGPSEKLVAACHGDTITILETSSGKPVGRRMRHPGSDVYGLAWHPGGVYLASAHADRLVRVWDTRNGELLRTLNGHDREAVSVAFNHTGDLLASAGWDVRVRIWDFRTGRELINIIGGGFALKFSPDDQLLSCHSWDADFFQIYEIASSKVLRAFHYERGGADLGLGQCAFTENGRLLAYSSNNQLKIWDVTSGQQLISQSIPFLNSVLIDSSGKDLITTSDCGVQFWPLLPGTIPGELSLGSPTQLTGPYSFGLAAASADGKVLAFVQSNRCHIIHRDFSHVTVSTDIQQSMRWVAISPSGAWVATSAWGREGVKVWSASNGVLCAQLPSARYSDVRFSPDGRSLVTRTDKEYLFWKVGEWTCYNSFSHEPVLGYGISCVMALTPDGQTLAVSDIHSLRLLDAATGRELAVLDAEHARENSSLTFTSDGRWLAVAGGWDRLHVWDLLTLREDLARMGLDWKRPPLASVAPLNVGTTKVITLQR